jgi:NAD(P)-dependent dehydrogenase (short-subunit alcohol dehydrogenase family)
MINVFDKGNLSNIIDSIPLKRLGDPEDIAELACLVASDYGSFMTGTTIDINGGLFIG